MGVFQAGVLIPLAFGPVIGGALGKSLGWRSIFWFLAIYSGIFLIILMTLLPETLRALVGNGSVPGTGIRKYPLNVYQRRHLSRHSGQATSNLPSRKPINILGSFQILVDKRIIAIILFLAVYYTVWQMSITVLSTLFKSIYGLNDAQIGLTFMANGVGSTLGTLLTGKILDIDYRKIKQSCDAKGEEIPLDRARLRTIWIWSAMQMSSVLVFGWTLNQRFHIAVPIICTFFTSWGAMCIQSMITTYLVDVFSDRSASASAALNLARCLMGAGGTAVVLPILNALGTGWGFTLFTAIMCASLGLVALQLTLGKKRRQQEDQEKTNSVPV